jgi:hypothetical protein
MALPWGTDAVRDPLLDASASLALLAAAKQLTRGQNRPPGLGAEEVVLRAMAAMSESERVRATTALKLTQERIYALMQTLRAAAGGGTIGAAEVEAALNNVPPQ